MLEEEKNMFATNSDYWLKRTVTLRLFLLYCLLIAAFGIQHAWGREAAQPADSLKCLIFSKDQSVNKVPLFRKIHQVNFGSIVYSASSDLNNDNKLEYFYYLNEPGALSCGTISLQIGCPVKIYTLSKRKKLIDISADEMYPGRDFNPEKHHDYLCISSEKSNGWQYLIESTKAVHPDGGEGSYRYDGTTYKLINKGN